MVGSVYLLKLPLPLAVKKVDLGRNGDNYKREVAAYNNNALLKSGLIPNIYNSWYTRNYGYIAMQRLEPCRISAREKNNILYELTKLGWNHGDPHNDNFMCNRNGKPIIIDFGKATKMTNQERRDTMDAFRGYSKFKN